MKLYDAIDDFCDAYIILYDAKGDSNEADSSFHYMGIRIEDRNDTIRLNKMKTCNPDNALQN